ncbi:dual specificity calcium/calmodulin-dependent 3',5'-cyclic nucleotide phosphodiesterase 1A-like [Antedon mediterranea]|uniref:dual specificity calcium/calmodulin-dependent 3',5'-cyclic nucleotide phosphodiesterase 1A-like n=1 Tax=Antedon mediterranea TaxID=105859 RepID=UPI003AF489F1
MEDETADRAPVANLPPGHTAEEVGEHGNTQVVVAQSNIMSKNVTSKEVDGSMSEQKDVSLNSENLPSPGTSESVSIATERLRALIHRVDNGDFDAYALRSTLKYVADVLDSVRQDENRMGLYLNNDEDCLSEVPAEEIPDQVRDWLTSTFCRPNVRSRGPTDEKPRFKSIVQALRTGMFLDRMFRRASGLAGVSYAPSLSIRFKTVDDWNFDVFALNDETENHALKYTTYELFTRYDLINKFKIPSSALHAFLDVMEAGYQRYRNPYHNHVHAADVLQTVHHIIVKMGIVHWLSDLEILSALLAALIHDYEHTGTSNAFHANTSTNVALLYNDRAVLENHHISSTFRILRDEDKNILVNLSREDFRELRRLVIEMVLATDMSFHFQQIKQIKSWIGVSGECVDKAKALSLILHCSDISHPAKHWDLHYKWTRLLMQEFFLQGDREMELGLPCSPLCDRRSTFIAESQIGFIDFIVEPTMLLLGDLIDKILKEVTDIEQESTNCEQNTTISKRNSLPATSTIREGSTLQTGCQSGRSSVGRPSMMRQTTIPNKAPRVWLTPLKQNSKLWKERAAQDAIERSKGATDVELHLSDIEDPTKKYVVNDHRPSIDSMSQAINMALLPGFSQEEHKIRIMRTEKRREQRTTSLSSSASEDRTSTPDADLAARTTGSDTVKDGRHGNGGTTKTSNEHAPRTEDLIVNICSTNSPDKQNTGVEREKSTVCPTHQTIKISRMIVSPKKRPVSNIQESSTNNCGTEDK